MPGRGLVPTWHGRNSRLRYRSSMTLINAALATAVVFSLSFHSACLAKRQERVLLRDTTALTLRKGQMTLARRSSYAVSVDQILSTVSFHADRFLSSDVSGGMDAAPSNRLSCNANRLASMVLMRKYVSYSDAIRHRP